MTPEEGKPVQVNTALHSESLQLPEESLTEVKGHLSPENFVSQQDPETGDVRTVTGQIVKCYGAGQVPTNISLHWSPSRPSWIWRHPLDILCGIAVLIKQKAKIAARPK